MPSFKVQRSVIFKRDMEGKKRVVTPGSQGLIGGTGKDKFVPRKFKKGTNYKVMQIIDYGGYNHHTRYIFGDSSFLDLYINPALVFEYIDQGYVDPVMKRQGVKPKRKNGSSGGSSGSFGKSKNSNSGGSVTSNEKAIDGQAGVDGNTNYFTEEELKSMANELLLSTGEYERTIINGKETFRKKDGSFVQSTTNYGKYSESTGNVHNSKYGGNVTKLMKDLKGVHGLPAQFLPSADTRYSGSKIGRVYKKHIMNNVPLLLIAPCIPKFMDEISSDNKKDLLKAVGKFGNNVMLDQLVGDDAGMYYTSVYRYSEYYTYVNTILNAMANLMGIGDMKYDGYSLNTYKWQKFATKASGGIISSSQNIPFYIDAQSVASETFSNSTETSQLAEKINTPSQLAKELQFVIGGAGSSKFKELLDETYGKTISGLESALNKFNKILPEKSIKRLIKGFGATAIGGKIIFPEIWQDSEFNRNQEVTMKLVSPTGSMFDIYVNILVPLVHILCAAVPRQLGRNGFQSPYVIKAWYKGMYSSDLAIIDGLSIERGDKGRWSKDGLPLSVNISFTIKDLYRYLSISKRDGALGTDLIQNHLLLSYMANLCGINSFKPDILKTLDLYKTSVQNIKSDIIQGLWDGVTEDLTNVFNRGIDRQNAFQSITSAGIAHLINNYKPKSKKNNSNGSNKPNPNSFPGVERKYGESDEEYAFRVYSELDKWNNQQRKNEIYKDIPGRLKKYNHELLLYNEELKMMNRQQFNKRFPKASQGGYRAYVNANFRYAEQRIVELRKKYKGNPPNPNRKPLKKK